MKVSIDSRTIEPGDYFIPVKGPNFDGRDFISEAVAKGGVLLDVDLTDYAKKYRKKLGCKVIGVTGSAGKTTIKDMIASVLGRTHTVVKTQQNQNNEIGVPLTVLAADHLTDYLVVEMAMRKAGDIRQLTQIVQPDIVVVTGIGMTHIQQFKTPRQVALAKGEIFRKAQAWQKNKRTAFINYASNYPEVLTQKAEKVGYRVLPFTGETKPEQNINVCYTLGHYLGIPDDQIKDGIQQFEPSAHRLHVQKLGAVTLIDDSYNANPDGLQFAFQYIKPMSGRKIAVLGDMLELGTYSEKAHRQIADWALDTGISIIFSIGTEIEVLQSPDIPIFHFNDKAALNQAVSNELKSGDIVLVKGSRGLKMEETVSHLESVLG